VGSYRKTKTKTKTKTKLVFLALLSFCINVLAFEITEPIRSFKGHSGAVYSVAFSPNSQYILTGSDDKTARKWKTNTGKEIQKYTSNYGVWAAEFHRDGRHIITKEEPSSGYIYMWDEKTGDKVKNIENYSFKSDVGLYNYGLSYDGTKILAKNENDNKINILDSKTKRILYIIHLESTFANAVFSPNDKYILTGTFRGVAKLWRVPVPVVYSNLSSKDEPLTLQEISTMALYGVKIAFSGEYIAKPISSEITPSQILKAEYIDLSGMHLRKLPPWLSKFTKLRRLNLSNNNLHLEKLGSLRTLRVLEELSLANNPLFESGYYDLHPLLSSMRNLRKLSLESTGGDIDAYGHFQKPIYLQELNLSKNFISSIDLDYLSNRIKVLDLSHNRLAELKYKEMPALEKLHIQGNKGLVLNEAFGDPFSLQNLRVVDFDSSVTIPDGLKLKLEHWKKIYSNK